MESKRNLIIFFVVATVLSFVIRGLWFVATEEKGYFQDDKVANVAESPLGEAQIPENTETPQDPSAQDLAASTDANDGQDNNVPPNDKVNPQPLFSGEYQESPTRLYSQEIYKIEAKYPMVMKQKVYELSSENGGARKFVGERQFVADHIVVKIKDGWDEAMVSRSVEKLGFELRKKLQSNHLYLISFPVLKHDSWNRAAEALKALDMVSSVAPDIYGKAIE